VLIVEHGEGQGIEEHGLNCAPFRFKIVGRLPAASVSGKASIHVITLHRRIAQS
jgi:hypothetical protein